jgi:hypothetical protein
MKPLFNGFIRNGELCVEDAEKFDSYVKNFEGKEVHISVGLKNKDRSNNQNRYYWGVVIEILQKEIGYETKEMMHDALRFEFLQLHTEKLPTVRSTTDLTTVEFEEYLSRIRQWSSEQGIYIPLPHEVDYD